MRRTAGLLALALTASLVLTACGDSDSSSDAAALDNVTVTGDLGREPEVTITKSFAVTDTQVKTLVEGAGPTVGSDASVFLQYWVGNAYNQQRALSSYDAGTGTPQLTQMIEGSTLPAMYDAVVGAKVGSRLLVAAPPKDTFKDQGLPSAGIGNGDTIVFVLDVMGVLADGPSGTPGNTPAWNAPKVTTNADDVPIGLDFAGVPAPDATLRKGILIQGDGAALKKGDQVYVHYLGAVYKGAKPFDQNYDGQPFQVTIGAGGVIDGWQQGLLGTRIGSRILLKIPPALGYGDSKDNASIPPNSTLYFVIDILGVAPKALPPVKSTPESDPSSAPSASE